MARIWRDNGLKPWKVQEFKFSDVLDLEAKLVAVAGLHLNPPEPACMRSSVTSKIAPGGKFGELRTSSPSAFGYVVQQVIQKCEVFTR